LLSVVLLSYTAEPILFKWLIEKSGRKRVLPVTLSDILFTIVSLSIGLILCIFLNLLFFIVFPLPISSKTKKKFLHHGVYWCVKMSSYGLINIKTKTINEPKEKFIKPAIIISNHQSHIDLPLLLMQSPKIIVLTNKWVWNNPLYALVIRYLGFYSVTNGYEPLIEKLRRKTEEGYSILVFPEGSRSPDSKIRRFHKGAFLLAEKLNLDILPVIIHGAGDCMTKGENHLRSGAVAIKIFPRIKPEDNHFGIDYHERSKALLGFFRDEYSKMKSELETPAYFRRKLLRNYIYKGPLLEWYTRVKLTLEHNYEIINKNIPHEAQIVDIGCGYGMISYMLSFTSEKRKILGVDYDNDKIRLASNCISKNERINFVAADAVTYNYPDADVFLLSDVLHYIPEEKQEELLTNCINHLKPEGIIMIRDADKDLKKRHLGTRYTEFFSTRSGFNKSLNRKLFFFSGRQIHELADRNNMRVDVIDETKLTSNLLYILRH
jgi:1-acyl-sn-glycerol-3-phosphate acyltransferase